MSFAAPTPSTLGDSPSHYKCFKMVTNFYVSLNSFYALILNSKELFLLYLFLGSNIPSGSSFIITLYLEVIITCDKQSIVSSFQQHIAVVVRKFAICSENNHYFISLRKTENVHEDDKLNNTKDCQYIDLFISWSEST